MNQTEQLIKVGRAYIDALNNLKEDNPETLYPLLDILNCVHPDRGYELGVVIEEPSPYETPTHKCDQAWFFCYLGYLIPITRRSNIDNGCHFHLGNMCYLRFTFDFLNHLSIEPSAMGAWQAYLLSIAKTLLPFSGRLYYTKRKLIFSPEQLNDVKFIEWKGYKKSDLVNLNEDVSPSVYIKGKQAVVSCCYWNDWGGLIRERATITFFNDRVYLFDDFEEEILFEYDLGIRY